MIRFVQNRRGMALIVTILIISLVVALTLQLNASMRADAYSAANVRDGIRLGYVARSGFNYAMAVLKADALADADDDSRGDSFVEDWHSEEAFAEGAASLFSQARFQLNISDLSGRIQVNKLVDEEGKPDSNQIALLTRFLSSSEFGLSGEQAEDIVAAMVDWIDPDDETYDEAGIGAEEKHYLTKDPPYPCRNGPIEFLEELLFVEGVSRELFDKIRDSLSPYGDGKINVNTADRFVLQALSPDIDSRMMDSMDNYRQEEGNDLSEVNWGERTGTGEAMPEDIADLLVTKSAYFEIQSDGFEITSDDFERTPGGIEGVIARRVTGVVQRDKEAVKVLWFKVE